MSFHMYDSANDDFIDLEDSAIGHEDHEDALVEFAVLDDTHVQVMFNLNIVRIHSLSDGDVVITLKT